MKWLYLIGGFCLLMMMGFVSADEDRTITVEHNGTRYQQTFADQFGTSTYQFALNVNLFNQTENITDDAAIWVADITAGTIEDGDIEAVNIYSFDFRFNNTWTASYQFSYTPQNLGFWKADYNFFLVNGSTTIFSCHTDTTVWAGKRLGAPNPEVRFNVNVHGRYATSPSLEIVADDSLSKFAGVKACNSPDSVGGGLQFIMGQITATPSVSITQGDEQLYVHTLRYYFEHRSGALADQDEFNAANAQCGQQTFIIFGLCDIGEGLLGLIKFTLGFIETGKDLFINHVPYVGPLVGYLLVPFELIFGLFELLLTLATTTTPEHGMGDVLWMHIIYTMSWGAIFAGFTGNFLWLFLTPYYFVKYIFLGLAYAFYGLFVWLPIKMWEFIVELVPG